MNVEKNYEVGYVLLFDKEFSIKEKILPGVIHSLIIKNLQRSLVLKFRSKQQMNEWKSKIETAIADNLLCRSHRFGSFAPMRKNQRCKWYLNASRYMEDVLKGIQAAKEEIFITDWWLSPELFLVRPTSSDIQFRLDKVLQKKAVSCLFIALNKMFYKFILKCREKVSKSTCFYLKKWKLQ